jgi:hypothetical protein
VVKIPIVGIKQIRQAYDEFTSDFTSEEHIRNTWEKDNIKEPQIFLHSNSS